MGSFNIYPKTGIMIIAMVSQSLILYQLADDEVAGEDFKGFVGRTDGSSAETEQKPFPTQGMVSWDRLLRNIWVLFQRLLLGGNKRELGPFLYHCGRW